MKPTAAVILREYGPFPGIERIHGLTYDGQRVWFGAGESLNAFDPASGEIVETFDVKATRARPSTAGICSRLRATASRRWIA